MKIAIFGGGGSWGCWQAKAFEEYVTLNKIEKYDHFAGTSVGALAATFIASNSPDGLLVAAAKYKEVWKDRIKGNHSVFAKRLKFLPKWLSWVDYLMGLFGLGIYKTDPLAQLIEDELGDRDLSKLPLSVGVTNLSYDNYEELWSRHPRFLNMVKASASIPILFEPYVDEDGIVYVDGGIKNNLPYNVTSWYDGKIEQIDIFSCNSFHWNKKRREIKSIFDIVLFTLQCLLEEQKNSDVKQFELYKLRNPDCKINIIYPSYEIDMDFSVFDPEKIQTILSHKDISYKVRSL